MIIWFHCFSIVGLVTTRNECNVLRLIGDSIPVQAECECLEWKNGTVLKESVLIGTSACTNRGPWIRHHEPSNVCPACFFAENIKFLESTTPGFVTDLVRIAHMDSQEADSTLEVVVSHPISGIGSGVPSIHFQTSRVFGGGVPG